MASDPPLSLPPTSPRKVSLEVTKTSFSIEFGIDICPFYVLMSFLKESMIRHEPKS